MRPETALRRPSQDIPPRTHGLWSLWELMINFNASGLVVCVGQLMAAENEYRQLAVFADLGRDHPAQGRLPSIYATDENKAQVSGWVDFASLTASRLGLEPVLHRSNMFKSRLHGAITLNDLAAELRVLRETLEGELRFQHFYHYPKEKSLVLLRRQGDWAATLSAFPSAAQDIDDAVDCYALERNAACVFYCMRVLEVGLKSISEALNVNFEAKNWQNVLDEIEAQIRFYGDRWKQGPSKLDWLQFYSVAAKEFFFFKDGWRNYIAHKRVPYDANMAKGTLDHVMAFMNHLSLRLSE